VHLQCPSQTSDFIRLQKAGIAIREVCKCVGLLSNNTIIDRSAFHFQSSEHPVKIIGTFGVALHDTLSAATSRTNHHMPMPCKTTKTRMRGKAQWDCHHGRPLDRLQL